LGVRHVSTVSYSSSASTSLSRPIAKYTVRKRRPPSQAWKTFLRNHAPNIGAIDLFVIRTIDFKLLYGPAMIKLQRRHLVLGIVASRPIRGGLHH
jgi:hypothetical protein